jgi:hypothetical protein
MSPAARSSVLALILVVMVVLIAPPSTLHADSSSLSSYWQPTITRWADLIEKYAQTNGLDPNLVAAVIEEESKGNPRLISAAGAVGLMQIMPYEVGFTWRPRAARLKDPEMNLEWGTNTLGQVIRQAQGRISLALLAYNSGWDRIHLRSTRIFATKVLDHYARSILTDAGLDLNQLRSCTLYIVAHSSAGPIQADRIESDGTFEPLPDFDPTTLSPDLLHSIAYAAIDENHIAWWVDVWVEPVMNQATSDFTLSFSRRARE